MGVLGMRFKWIGDPPPEYASSEPEPPRPQCEHTVSSGQLTNHLRRWRRERYYESNWQKCQRHAHVEINGSKYCRLHGGMVALDILARADEAAPAAERVWVVGDPQNMGDYEVAGVYGSAQAAQDACDTWDLVLIGDFGVDEDDEEEDWDD